MGNDIKVTLSGNDAALVAVWQRQNAQILKNQKALIAMGQAGEQAGTKIAGSMDKSNSGLQKALGTIQQFGSAMLGVGAVMKGLQFLTEQIKREYEHLRGQQTRAGTQQVATAAVQREMFDNLGQDATLTPAMANAAVARISQATSMKPTDVMTVMSSALAFKERSATAASVVPLAEMAAKMYPDNAQAAAADVQSLQAIGKIKNKASAKDIQGFLLAAQLASPVTEAANFGTYGAPAIAQAISLGNTPREAAAFYGALGQGIGDKEGRVTGTSSIEFLKQMKEKTAGKVQGGITEQLAWLQTPAGLNVKRKLLGPLMKGAKNAKEVGLTGEAKAFATLIGLVSGEGRYTEMFQGTLADTPDLEGAGKYVDEREERLAADPLQRNARIDRLLASAGERSQLTQTGAGRQGITIGRLKELLTSSGASEWEIDAAMEAYKTRTEGSPEGIMGKLGVGLGLITPPSERQSPDEAAAGVLEFVGKMKRSGRNFTVMNGMQQGPVTDEMSAAADALEAAASLIREGARKDDNGQQAKAGPGAANQRQPAAVGGR